MSLENLEANDFVGFVQGGNPTFEFLGQTSVTQFQFGYILRTTQPPPQPGTEVGIADFSVTVGSALVAQPPPLPPVSITPFEIFDDTFNAADWEQGNLSITDITAAQTLTGGNPDAYRAGFDPESVPQFGPPGRGQSIHRYIGPGAEYDPANRTNPASIEFSFDVRYFYSEPQTVRFRPVSTYGWCKMAEYTAPHLIPSSTCLEKVSPACGAELAPR